MARRSIAKKYLFFNNNGNDPRDFLISKLILNCNLIFLQDGWITLGRCTLGYLSIYPNTFPNMLFRRYAVI
ncbi:hypothetical protein AFLA_011052 [Aspergillus flavus NRRL3357]|nr:hypothetical protein AFLA_011052 [Aspergillus flavus NRRL3357]